MNCARALEMISHMTKNEVGLKEWNKEHGHLQEVNPNSPLEGKTIHVELSGEWERTLKIETCSNPSMQELYEDRLIKSYFYNPPYKNESVFIAHVVNPEQSIDVAAAVVYIDPSFPYNIEYKQNEIIVGSVVAFENGSIDHRYSVYSVKRNKLSVYQPKSDAWPRWITRITEENDLYKSPLNLDAPISVRYLEDPEAYWGANLFYSRGLHAAIRIEDKWIKIPSLWLDKNVDQLPSHIQREYTFMKQMDQLKQA